MKKYIFSRIPKSLPLLLLGIISLQFISCKKDKETKVNTSFCSFTYKGKDYTLYPMEGAQYEWSIGDYNLFISRPDLFNGTIYYTYQNQCAYLEPTGTYISLKDNCTFTFNGLPIDSTTFYRYNSGSMISSKSNYTKHSDFDPFRGEYTAYTLFDFEGTFDLTLINNKNETIEISNGRFKNHNVRE